MAGAICASAAPGRTTCSTPSCRTTRGRTPERVLRASRRALAGAPAKRSGVAGFARELGAGHADLAERALPLAVEVAFEHQVGIGRHGQPAIGLDLGLELA